MFEREVGEFLDREWLRAGRDAERRAEARFIRALVRRGWSVPHWPRGSGGTGWAAARLRRFDCMLADAGAPCPDPVAVDLVAGLLLEHGSAAQREALLPGIRDASVRWCAHPSVWEQVPLAAGRDASGALVSLDAQTTGCRDAHAAQWMIALAADADEPGRLGIVLLALGAGHTEIVRAPDPTVMADRVELVARPLAPAEVLVDPEPAERVLATVRANRDRGFRACARRLAHVFARLEPVDDAHAARRHALEVDLLGLDALESRAFALGDPRLAAAARQRHAAAAVEVAQWLLDALGYYALPALDPLGLDNEAPILPAGAQRALGEAFGYVGRFEDGSGRDRIARLLGLG